MIEVLLFDSLQLAEKTIGLNETKKFSFEDHEFCVHRNSKGLFAFESKCPHMSDEMTKAKVNASNEVVCPWHAYRFDLSTGEESEQRCKALKIYPLNTEEGAIKITL
ncbi:MAG: Rieske 2Fe-2S domain-containing protein [Reichenbachiella sp.]